MATAATSVARAGAPHDAPGTPATPHPAGDPVHDHAPRHGGVVGMAGTRHVEAALRADGLMRVHLSDLYRAPLSLDGVRGRVTLAGTKDRGPYPLEVRGGALEARIPPADGPAAEVRVEVALPDGEPLLIDFTLPVTGMPR